MMVRSQLNGAVPLQPPENRLALAQPQRMPVKQPQMQKYAGYHMTSVS
jgi:hypothetical protein